MGKPLLGKLQDGKNVCERDLSAGHNVSHWRSQDFSTGGGGANQGSGAGCSRGVPRPLPTTVGRFVKIGVSKWHFVHIKCNCIVGYCRGRL